MLWPNPLQAEGEQDAPSDTEKRKTDMSGYGAPSWIV